MASKTPLPCDPKIFAEGKPLLFADTSDCGVKAFEGWVRKLAEQSGQQVDWHYSGGVAQVLYLGDGGLQIAVIAQEIPCPAQIMRWCIGTGEGLFRTGVTPAPLGAIAAYYDGKNTQFISGESEEGQPQENNE